MLSTAVQRSVLAQCVVSGFARRCASDCSARTSHARPAWLAGVVDEEEDSLLGKGSGLGRDALLQRPLWDQYSSKVHKRMAEPLFRGEITPEDAEAMGCDLVVADHGAEACGDMVKLYWAVDKKTHKIKQARFRSFGCGTAIAAADATAELCVGHTVDEARRLVTSTAVEHHLRDDPSTPAVPPQKMHCSVMASEVVRKASETAGVPGDAPSAEQAQCCKGGSDEDIICECARVSLRTVRDAIREHGLKTVAEVTAHTKAGGFCGSCVKPGGHEKRARYLVDVVRDERRVAAVQRALLADRQLCRALEAHGGSVECVAIEGNTAKVRFQGSCCGCPYSSTGTLELVQDSLRKSFNDKSITVAIANA